MLVDVLELTASDVRDWARATLADPDAPIDPWTLVPVSYDGVSPTTGALYRIVGPGWSVFAKVVQSFRHWSVIDAFPPAARAEALRSTAWRHEADLYASPLAPDVLPAGLRLPTVWAVRDLGDDRVLVVLEDVQADPDAWDDERYRAAARMLGRLDVRLTRADRLPTTSFHEPGAMNRMMYETRVVPFALPALRDDRTWAHPLLTGAAARRLRDDLDELAGRLPALLDVLDHLPQVRTHGDASPHNLLVPLDGSGDLVVIDWAMSTVAAVGDELGQLLVGRAHDGELAVEDLPALHELVVSAYTQGLADEGELVSRDAVRVGMDGGLAVRSAFTALPLERLGEPLSDELAELVERRLALTRYLVDVGLEVSRSDALAGVSSR